MFRSDNQCAIINARNCRPVYRPAFSLLPAFIQCLECIAGLCESSDSFRRNLRIQFLSCSLLISMLQRTFCVSELCNSTLTVVSLCVFNKRLHAVQNRKFKLIDCKSNINRNINFVSSTLKSHYHASLLPFQTLLCFIHDGQYTLVSQKILT